MALSIFYSWQTDSPSSTNRNFIEDALKRAIKQLNADAEIVNSTRNESLALDKDTKGLPGMPPIAQSLFDKIDGCAVFVPDLTFVAKTGGGRPTPNPNVLIEFGWALKSQGNSRIVPVMNTAFGAPTVKSLPFNIRHLTWPRVYELAKGVRDPRRSDERAALVKGLVEDIRVVLDSTPSGSHASSPGFEPTRSTFDNSVYFQPGEELATWKNFRDQTVRYSAPANGAKMFLRLIPTTPTAALTPKGAYDLAISELETFGCRPITGGVQYERNQYGAIAYRTVGDRSVIYELTQVFKSRELWGVNSEPDGWRNSEGDGYLTNIYEDAFCRVLLHYVSFAHTKLDLTPPLRVIAGFTGINDYKIAASSGFSFNQIDKFGGKAVEPRIIFDGVIDDWSILPETFLMPFFEQVWEAFGLDRPNTPL